jgi:hypothetical protein
MSLLLLEDQREEIRNEIIETERILMQLACLEPNSLPKKIHTSLLIDTCALWLKLNCILAPDSKWRIDSDVLTILAEIPYSFPLLIEQMKNHQPQEGLH